MVPSGKRGHPALQHVPRQSRHIRRLGVVVELGPLRPLLILSHPLPQHIGRRLGLGRASVLGRRLAADSADLVFLARRGIVGTGGPDRTLLRIRIRFFRRRSRFLCRVSKSGHPALQRVPRRRRHVRRLGVVAELGIPRLLLIRRHPLPQHAGLCLGPRRVRSDGPGLCLDRGLRWPRRLASPPAIRRVRIECIAIREPRRPVPRETGGHGRHVPGLPVRDVGLERPRRHRAGLGGRLGNNRRVARAILGRLRIDVASIGPPPRPDAPPERRHPVPDQARRHPGRVGRPPERPGLPLLSRPVIVIGPALLIGIGPDGRRLARPVGDAAEQIDLRRRRLVVPVAVPRRRDFAVGRHPLLDGAGHLRRHDG